MDVAPDDEQFLMIKEGRDPNAYRPRRFTAWQCSVAVAAGG